MEKSPSFTQPPDSSLHRQAAERHQYPLSLLLTCNESPAGAIRTSPGKGIRQTDSCGYMRLDREISTENVDLEDVTTYPGMF